VFNMGIGMIAVVDEDGADAIRGAADTAGLASYVIGQIEDGEGVSYS
jgi:phosphoribosylformylglycinamidine cyclo-ligase